LRLGFENFTIIDGDQVELSNLNRQNYTEEDIAVPKVEALKKRLLSINKNAKINIHNCYLRASNLEQYISGHSIAINALDFSSDVPLLFDKICHDYHIPVLHPYNIGWGSIVAVVVPGGQRLDSITRPNIRFNEVEFVEYALGHLAFWGNPQEWMRQVLDKYLSKKHDTPPQLSIGSWLAASMCSKILFDIATDREIKKFPDFYFSTLKDV
jgi:molybdopterin/thiamine biosynthesis adenylyltransferase